MSVEVLARQLAAADPAKVQAFLATCDDPAEHAAIEAALALLERERMAELAGRWPTLPPDEAEAVLAGLGESARAVLQEELDEADLEAFLEGRRMEDVRAAADVDGPTWFSSFFPGYAVAGFAPHMVDVWQWAWTIRRGQRVRPYVACWFRGGTKSSTAEGITAAVAAHDWRRYGLYISGTQSQADKHVATLGSMMESRRFAAAYPEAARRAVTQYGASRGWSRTRLHTASGFIIDALGLQVDARGIKVEEARPDFIVLDDIDSLSDGPAMVQKKIELLTETILPAGSPDLVVLVVQNVIHPNSIMARLVGLADEPADFLVDRIVSGPVPAVEDLDVEPEQLEDGRTRWVVKGGRPTWAGFGLDVMQDKMDTEGLTAVLRERQHVVNARAGGMFSHLSYRHVDPADVPFLIRRACWVDPAVTNSDTSDACAIQVDGTDAAGQLYRLWSWEARSTPLRALCLAIRAAVRYGCPYVGVETDQGGETWDSVYREAATTVTTQDPDKPSGIALDGAELLTEGQLPGFAYDKAGRSHESKVERAAHMLVEYEGTRAPIHVLGTHTILEAALFRFGPQGTKPFDLVDACLVAGTLVDTAAGPVPIEEVRPGHLVWTRTGLAPVKEAGRTGIDRPVYEVRTADGRRLVGTAEHPVWTKEQGWTPLSECAGLSLLTRPPRSSTEAGRIAATRSRRADRRPSTTARLARVRAAWSLSTGRSGSITTGRFRKAGTSTTSTTTPSTTPPGTSTRYSGERTAASTARRGSTTRPWRRTSPASDPSPPTATAPPSRWPRRRGTPADSGLTSRLDRGYASGAVRSSRAAAGSGPATARSDAVTTWPSTTRASGHSSARVAATSSPGGGGRAARVDSAASRVVTVLPLGTADVWNLEVDGPHEYFAEGVLVHNCYWSWHDLRKGGTATLRSPQGMIAKPPINGGRGEIRIPTSRFGGGRLS